MCEKNEGQGMSAERKKKKIERERSSSGAAGGACAGGRVRYHGRLSFRCLYPLREREERVKWVKGQVDLALPLGQLGP